MFIFSRFWLFCIFLFLIEAPLMHTNPKNLSLKKLKTERSRLHTQKLDIQKQRLDLQNKINTPETDSSQQAKVQSLLRKEKTISKLIKAIDRKIVVTS